MEKTKNQLKLSEYQDIILDILTTATGNILDDENLVQTLNETKETNK